MLTHPPYIPLPTAALREGGTKSENLGLVVALRPQVQISLDLPPTISEEGWGKGLKYAISTEKIIFGVNNV